MLSSHRKDALIDWIKEVRFDLFKAAAARMLTPMTLSHTLLPRLQMLHHSFVLNAPRTYRDTMLYIQELVEEHCRDGANSTLRSIIPSVGPKFTVLPLAAAFDAYDGKYAISGRRFVAPSFNEIRHMLNLAQVMTVSSPGP